MWDYKYFDAKMMSDHNSSGANQGNVQKYLKLFIVDSDRVSNLETGYACWPRGIVGHFPKSKIASKMATEHGEI